MNIWDRLRAWARAVKRYAVAFWFARRNAGTSWAAKALGVFVVAYALSPIDLIPDFVPVLGYLDDMLLLPGLMWPAIRLLPPIVLTDLPAPGRRVVGAWRRETAQISMLWVSAA